MDIGTIALIIMGVLGLLMIIAPEKCTRADQRDDPESVAKIKKLGIGIMIFAAFCGLLMLKYKLL